MDAQLCFLLLTLLLCCGLGSVSAATLPASFSVLPLSSFTNATVVAGHACTPSYSSSPCNGHGECYLLFDLTANDSQQLLNASTAQPLPASSTNLVVHGIDVDTPLPAAVCICDSGYTGLGDYIQHYALDGDSCGISDHVVSGSCIVGIVLFAVLTALALHRLSRWYSWYTQDAEGVHAAVLIPSKVSSKGADEPSKPHGSHAGETGATRAVVVVSPKGVTSPGGNECTNNNNSKSPIKSTQAVQSPAGGGGVVTRRLSIYKRPNAGSGGAAGKCAAFTHLSFCHPFCALILAVSTAAYYGLRLATDRAIGKSFIVGALYYTSHHAYFIGSCIATYHMLRLAATITRSQTGTGGLTAVLRRVRLFIYGLVGYSLVVWLLLILLPCYPNDQQTTSIIVLTALHAPMWALAILSLTATRSITSTLVQHLDKLPAQQRDARTAMCRKLRSQSDVVLAMVLINVSTCLLLASVSWIRQAGQAYFHLFNHFLSFLTLFIRLLLIQPPGRIANGNTGATVAPHNHLSPAATRVSHQHDVKGHIHIHRSSQENGVTEALTGSVPARQQPQLISGGVRHERASSAVSSSTAASSVQDKEEQQTGSVRRDTLEAKRQLLLSSSSISGSAAVDVQVLFKPRSSMVSDMK